MTLLLHQVSDRTTKEPQLKQIAGYSEDLVKCLWRNRFDSKSSELLKKKKMLIGDGNIPLKKIQLLPSHIDDDGQLRVMKVDRLLDGVPHHQRRNGEDKSDIGKKDEILTTTAGWCSGYAW